MTRNRVLEHFTPRVATLVCWERATTTGACSGVGVVVVGVVVIGVEIDEIELDSDDRFSVVVLGGSDPSVAVV